MNPETKDEVVQLYLDDIIPNRFQPREIFDEKALKELAVSIKEHGVIQPIIVRNVNGKYEIIAGERRYKASALAGLTRIPAIIRNLDDKESSKVALLENLQRKNLNPIEEARTYQKILEIDQMTQEELAKTMGKSQSAVANKLRLLSLSDEIQDALLKEQISERHARTLLNVADNKKQKELLKKIINEKMTVRALEDEINALYPKASSDKNGDDNDSSDDSGRYKPVTSQLIDNLPPISPTINENKEESIGKVTIVPPSEGEIPDNMKNANISFNIDTNTTPNSIQHGLTQETRINSTFDSNSNQNQENNNAINNRFDINNDSVITEPTDGIVNYGEIDKDNLDRQNNQNSRTDYYTETTVSPVDIQKIQANSFDIGPKIDGNMADLDTLLNIDKPQPAHNYQAEPGLNSVTVPLNKQSPLPGNVTGESEYFKVPDMKGFKLPDIASEKKNDNLFSIESVSNKPIDPDTAIAKVRSLTKELHSQGIKIEMDEMDFGKTYQVIIKIDK